MTAGPAITRAREAWGEDMPAWVRALAEACDGSSQSKTARRLEYSAATINQVLSRKYAGDTAKVEAAVRAVLITESVACPVLGEIDTQRCRAERRKPFVATNSQRAQLYRACQACPNNGRQP